MTRTAKLWKYFTIRDKELGKAECNNCKKLLSFKTTISNLKSHLKQQHLTIYDELCNELLNTNTSDEDSSDSGHQSTDVLSYFEQETGGRVRCIVCRASRSNNPEDLKNHLRVKHPKLIGAIGQDVAGSDASGNEDDGTFTEVIYLEEESKKTPKYVYKKEHKSNRSIEHKKTKKEKERKQSSSSDETPIKKLKHDNCSELDTFLTYIRCLLRPMPSDVCAKLQMDIINLIVSAKLNKNNEGVLETSTLLAKETIDRTSVVTVAEIPVSNIGTDAVDHCYVDADKTEN